jgi:hypothetical protein
MKYIPNSLKLFAFALLFVLSSGCEKDYLDINTDPNSPTNVPVEQILPAAQVNIGFVMGNELQRITGAIMQHYAGAGNQLLTYDQYDIQGSDVDDVWDGIYAGTLQDLNQIEQLSVTSGNAAYSGIAKLLKAYIYSVATDAFGDVPYGEALQDIRNTAPAFEQQESIYNDLFTLIDEGLADLNTGAGATVRGDLIYEGDLGLWQKMGNTLKMKLFLQIRKRDPARAAAGINALIGGNQLIMTNAENFQVAFLSTTDRQHPMYDFAFNAREADIVMSSRFIDSMAVLDDPRIPFYFNNNGQTNPDNQDSLIYNGFDNGGQGTAPILSERARLGEYTVGENGDAPQRLLTAFQTYFMLAESALTLNTTGNARAYFNNALDASMQEVGVGSTAATEYITRRLAAFDAAPNSEAKLSVVMRDKWVAQFGMSFEAWNDWRRTDYPRLAPATINTSPDELIPRRLPYSAVELTSNRNAPPTQVLVNERVWWDVE